MDSVALIATIADKARFAARTLSTATGAERKGALAAIAQALESRSAEILAANELDMVNARNEDIRSYRDKR